MYRSYALLGVGMLLAVDLTAQQAVASRFHSEAHREVWSAHAAIVPLRTEAPPTRRGSRAVQYLAGVAGMAVGATIGLGVGARYPSPKSDGLPNFLYAAAGAVVGSSVGVHLYGGHHGLTAPFSVTLFGGTLGLAGLVAAPITIPLGALLFYNIGSRARDTPASSAQSTVESRP